jgi:hypothetical protein
MDLFVEGHGVTIDARLLRHREMCLGMGLVTGVFRRCPRLNSVFPNQPDTLTSGR